eukprot:CAMPEP_0181391734 /NCGR_PEP_ID=MMETSP1106-20121128/26209_1 /TAXON_ID=81844 /ORGANISM="Mantoniella antarctica, Strain SL-175" /LENGTH=118 /DNA_ID=CAMNT_0023512797 /DNA_START=301 /DNA_END=655 /DNA_ORIENTATION=+
MRGQLKGGYFPGTCAAVGAGAELAERGATTAAAAVMVTHPRGVCRLGANGTRGVHARDIAAAPDPSPALTPEPTFFAAAVYIFRICPRVCAGLECAAAVAAVARECTRPAAAEGAEGH